MRHWKRILSGYAPFECNPNTENYLIKTMNEQQWNPDVWQPVWLEKLSGFWEEHMAEDRGQEERFESEARSQKEQRWFGMQMRRHNPKGLVRFRRVWFNQSVIPRSLREWWLTSAKLSWKLAKRGKKALLFAWQTILPAPCSPKRVVASSVWGGKHHVRPRQARRECAHMVKGSWKTLGLCKRTSFGVWTIV